MKARLVDLGRLEYRAAWDKQLEVWESVYRGGEDVLILVEHPPVLTLGANFHEENLRISLDEYRERGIDVVSTDRGGDVTYHGPGQLVAYPIFDVSRHGKDLHKWMRDLEEVLLILLAGYDLTGRRFDGFTGAWVEDEKVAAIGVKIKRWICLHGMALNCSNGAEGFDSIIPCGIADFGVTSLSKLLGRTVEIEEVKPRLVEAFESVFDLKIQSI